MSIEGNSVFDDRLTKKQKLKDTSSSSIEEWKVMLQGQTDIISNANEKSVTALLRRMCDEVQRANKEKEHRLLVSVADELPEQVAETFVDVNQSRNYVFSLLKEENLIAQMVKDAIKDGLTSW